MLRGGKERKREDRQHFTDMRKKEREEAGGREVYQIYPSDPVAVTEKEEGERGDRV